MSAALHLIPLAVSSICWLLLHRMGRKTGWFRIGELIFWDVIILIVVFLIWLMWF